VAMTSIYATVTDLRAHGVAFAPEIAQAAGRHGLDPRLLAAVAAQETGGPDTNAGSNVVGDGGHGRGVFQIDDRFHAFARTSAAMDPAENADYAAGMLRELMDRYGGDSHKALSAYNAGRPDAVGTTTRWGDGKVLGYADSVMRHYQRVAGPMTAAGAAPETAPGAARETAPVAASSPAPAFASVLSEAIAERVATATNINTLSTYHATSTRTVGATVPQKLDAGLIDGDDNDN
jgi:hypothetical protein